MKCIKKECSLYRDHDFNASWFNCKGEARTRSEKNVCTINLHIEDAEIEVERLNRIKEKIKKNEINRR